jgi:hypothetical protein
MFRVTQDLCHAVVVGKKWAGVPALKVRVAGPTMWFDAQTTHWQRD